MALTADIGALVNVRLTGSPDLGALTYDLTGGGSLKLSSAPGPARADLVFTDTRVLAASATEVLDLAGSLIGPFGDVLTFSRIKAIRVEASAANLEDVLVGGAGGAAWIGPFGDDDQTQAVRPGGKFLQACADSIAWPVVGGSADQLKIANGGASGSVVYSIVLVGEGAASPPTPTGYALGNYVPVLGF